MAAMRHLLSSLIRLELQSIHQVRNYTAISLLPYSCPTLYIGNVYITDNYNGRIRKLTASTGIITTIAGGGSDYDDGSATFGGDNGAATSAVLSFPYGVALDSSGRQYHMV